MKARHVVIALACLFSSWTSASALVLGLDERRSAEIYAARKHANLSLLRQSFAASGIVACGSATGAGQLVLASDIIVTAAHVLFDRMGNPRSEKCEFVIENDGFITTREFLFSSVVVGSSTPYQEPPSADWAVAKLSGPIVNVTPYALDSKPKRDVTLVSKGHQDWWHGTQTAYQDCRLNLAKDIHSGVKELSVQLAIPAMALPEAASFVTKTARLHLLAFSSAGVLRSRWRDGPIRRLTIIWLSASQAGSKKRLLPWITLKLLRRDNLGLPLLNRTSSSPSILAIEYPLEVGGDCVCRKRRPH